MPLSSDDDLHATSSPCAELWDVAELLSTFCPPALVKGAVAS